MTLPVSITNNPLNLPSHSQSGQHPTAPPVESTQETIRIRGARQHNLQNIDLEIPRNQFIVFTGVSGSGKSSLAFDTIFAEGQRRYVESLSAYARQFLGQVDKPDVDTIEGLSPAISIDQKSTSHNPRSTVGTVTEIYDYLRLLFGRAGEPHCPHCHRSIIPQTIDQMVDRIMGLPERSRFQILAPVVRGKKGTHKKLLNGLAAEGFVRVRVNGEVRELGDSIELNKNQVHHIEIVVDRLVKKEGLEERLVDSLTTCLRRSEGMAVIEIMEAEQPTSTEQSKPRAIAIESATTTLISWSDHLSNTVSKAAESPNDYASPAHHISPIPSPKELIFSENFACPVHGAVMDELSPRLFSFNSPYGACPECHGLGSLRTFSPELLVPDPSLPVYAAIAPWADKDTSYFLSLLYSVGKAYHFDIHHPWNQLTPEQHHILLHGAEDPIFIETDSRYSQNQGYFKRFEGVVLMLQKQYDEGSDTVKHKLESYLIHQSCPICHGLRLKPESLAVRLGPYRITDFTRVSIQDCLGKINTLSGQSTPEKMATSPLLSNRQLQIADLVLKEIRARLHFLLDVGLDYLTLDRTAMTLSGGEAQRIRLATQIGAGLTGVLYVLDEPSIGLHQRDNTRLLNTLTRLRDLGNTLIVVEHDEETIRAADHLVDIGPGAGVHGGRIIAQGDLNDLLQAPESLTGAYLSRRKRIITPLLRRPGNGLKLSIKGAHRNNLKNIEVDIPLGQLVCVTGVSGSGKSTLINELLYPAIQHHFGHKVPFPSQLIAVEGLNHLDKAIVIDQSPIGRTPRSNPATYTGTFDIIRQMFAETVEAKAKGYKAGQFSFNVKGGRCEACGGQGVNVIEMNFLPDVYVQCEVCKGSRYHRETLHVKYKGQSIADVLNMTVEEATEFCRNIPQAVVRLQTLVDVGLGYMRLGQTAPTLSGGEAQRVKLATELSRRATGKTLYLIDEPTTGLSFYDVHKLLDVVQRLVDKGNSVLMIEHNLDVIRCADWVIDLGPEGGDRGGELVAVGTPESVAKVPHSYTGQYLKPLLTP